MRRRQLLQSVLVAPAIIGLRAARADTPQLTVVSWGGSYQDAQSKALFQPAAKALGITVKEETYTGLAQLRMHVKSGAVSWDVVCSGSGTAARAGTEGLVQKLDYNVIDAADFIPGAAAPYMLAAMPSRPLSPGTRRPTAITVRRTGPTSGTSRNSPARAATATQ